MPRKPGNRGNIDNVTATDRPTWAGKTSVPPQTGERLSAGQRIQGLIDTQWPHIHVPTFPYCIAACSNLSRGGARLVKDGRPVTIMQNSCGIKLLSAGAGPLSWLPWVMEQAVWNGA